MSHALISYSVIWIIFAFSAFQVGLSYDTIYFYCNNRLYIDFNGLSSYQITNICSLMNQDDRFVVQITKQKKYNEQYDYTIESETFFKLQCSYNKIQCNYDFGISVFPNVGQVRITAGTISKDQLPKQYRVDVIDSMINDLKRNRYYEAITHAMTRISSSVPYHNSKVDIPNKSSSSSFGFFSFICFVICPILCCFGICYYYSTKSKEHIIEYEIKQESQEIHLHLSRLEELIKEIRKNSPPIVSINKCLLCMDYTQCHKDEQLIEMQGLTNYDQHPHNPYPTFEMIQSNNQQTLLNNSSENNTRFACQHLYHTSCLTEKNINHCLMCANSDRTREVVPNSSEMQVIDEGHVKALIQNLHCIYSQKELNDYARSYPGEFDSLNTTLIIGLAASWGITGVCATALLMNSYNNDIYGQNPIGTENHQFVPNVDTAGTNYEPSNSNENNEGNAYSQNEGNTYNQNEGNTYGRNYSYDDDKPGDTEGGDY